MATDEQKEQAKGHGWVDQPDFKGDPAKWIDADVFLERSETFIPFLNKAKKTLEGQLAAEKAERERLQREHEELRNSVKALEKIRADDNAADRDALRVDLKARIAAATKEGDGETVAELTEQLAELVSTPAAPAKPAAGAGAEPPPAGPPAYTPEFLAWRERNPWYGVDPDKSEYALYQAQRISRLEPSLRKTDFWDKVAAAVDKEFNPTPRHQKVDSSTFSGDGGGKANGKGYNDLPADAKAIVADEARTRVGPDKHYKTLADWQNAYAKVFFTQSLKT